MWSALVTATALVATTLPHAAADMMSGDVFSFESGCEHEAITSGDGACMWTGDAENRMSCDDCDGKCVVRANSSDISIGAQARVMQDALCTTLSAVVHAAGGGSSEDDDIMPPSECPSKDDVKSAYPSISAMRGQIEMSEDAEVFAMFTVHLESEANLANFFADQCESGTVTMDMDGANVSLKMCVNKGGATSAAFKAAMEVNAACQLADSDESGLKCLTPGSFMHVSADCLKVLAATVEADAELAATLSASFKAVHDECAKLTTQEACTGAELATQEAARKAAQTAAVDSATAMPSGALALRAAAAAAVGVALLAAALT